jgi:hypothetical protein
LRSRAPLRIWAPFEEFGLFEELGLVGEFGPIKELYIQELDSGCFRFLTPIQENSPSNSLFDYSSNSPYHGPGWGDLIVSNFYIFYVFKCCIPHSFEFETLRIWFSANFKNEKRGFGTSWY